MIIQTLDTPRMSKRCPSDTIIVTSQQCNIFNKDNENKSSTAVLYIWRTNWFYIIIWIWKYIIYICDYTIFISIVIYECYIFDHQFTKTETLYRYAMCMLVQIYMFHIQFSWWCITMRCLCLYLYMSYLKTFYLIKVTWILISALVLLKCVMVAVS